MKRANSPTDSTPSEVPDPESPRRELWVTGLAASAGALVALGLRAWLGRDHSEIAHAASTTAASVANASKGVIITEIRESSAQGKKALRALEARAAESVSEAAQNSLIDTSSASAILSRRAVEGVAHPVS